MKTALQLKASPERLPAEASAQAGSRRTLNILSTFLFYLSILFFIIGFNFSDNRAGGWTQQFMPNLGGRQIKDIYFLDSLTGWAVTPYVTQNDTAYVLKTTNGGDNWFFANIRTGQFVGHNRVYFLNPNTGFVCGASQTSGFKGLSKSTNGGFNWVSLNVPVNAQNYEDMSIYNEDTIWLIASESLTGGVYRTTNGGGSWEQQINLGSQNPDHIYMYNGRMGFISETNSYTRRTMDGGQNWSVVLSGSGQGFYDMYFSDSLLGWGTFSNTRKTTNGGLNWTIQIMPDEGNIVAPQIEKLSGLNQDTIYGTGAQILTGIGIRGMVNRTTNGGTNWLFQVPDSSFNANKYNHIDFYNKLIGWAYLTVPRGIHTTSGGDPIFYTSIKQINSNIPNEFRLFQNYPNPFNPISNIKYQITNSSYVILKVYDIQGREIELLVNQKHNTGVYETTFDGSNYSSGIYFYSLIVDGKLIDTKKMILIK